MCRQMRPLDLDTARLAAPCRGDTRLEGQPGLDTVLNVNSPVVSTRTASNRLWRLALRGGT